MQIQCPYCNGWTDSENDKCTLCGAPLTLDDASQNDQQPQEQDPGFNNSFRNRFDLGLSDGQGKYSFTGKHYDTPNSNESLLKQLFTPKIRIGTQYVTINSKVFIILLILSVIVGIIFLIIMPPLSMQ